MSMTPLPASLGGVDLVAWRLDKEDYASTWDSGEGAYQVGGRWSSPGVRTVYCSIDPSTTILEKACHAGFKQLDTVAHVLTEVEITEPGAVHIVVPNDVPNPNWLVSGIISPNQQTFGDSLLEKHAFVLIPSAVSSLSWNLLFVAEKAKGLYKLRKQRRFSLDTRLPK